MEFEKKNNSNYKIVMAVIVTALITFLLTTIGIYNYFTKTDDGNLAILAKYITFANSTNTLKTKIEIVKRYLQRNYIGELDEDRMLEQAVKGYVDGVGDEYTEYLTKDEFENLLIDVNGNYVGIGVYMAQNIYGQTIVLTPIEGSPAEEAGLKTGDVITKIDGEECTGLDTDIIANKIKGEEGTFVEIEILRENETIELKIERKKIELKYIDSSVLEGNIGYIRLLAFDENCSDKFKEHLENLKKQNIKSLIIDLRDNGGGIVNEVIGLSEMFIEKGNIIMQSFDKDNKATITKSTNPNPEHLKLVLLVNENSASAAEMFAAAIKDNQRGTVVGKKTFGKGVMQEVISLATGGALKVTIEEFKTPNGNAINKVGVEPDIEVDEVEGEEDAQLNKAIEILK